jgi:hypothetical protein
MLKKLISFSMKKINFLIEALIEKILREIIVIQMKIKKLLRVKPKKLKF